GEHNRAFFAVHRPSPPCQLNSNALLNEGQLVAAVVGIGEAEPQQTPANELLRRPTVDGKVILRSASSINYQRPRPAVLASWHADLDLPEGSGVQHSELFPLLSSVGA